MLCVEPMTPPKTITDPGNDYEEKVNFNSVYFEYEDVYGALRMILKHLNLVLILKVKPNGRHEYRLERK